MAAESHTVHVQIPTGARLKQRPSPNPSEDTRNLNHMSVSFVLYVSWMELQVPLPVLQQSRVTRLGGLPLSLGPLYPLSNSPTHTPYSQFRSIKSRLCACFITSLPFRLLRIYHVSSNSSNWKAFSAPVRKCKSCALLSQTQKKSRRKAEGVCDCYQHHAKIWPASELTLYRDGMSQLEQKIYGFTLTVKWGQTPLCWTSHM